MISPSSFSLPFERVPGVDVESGHVFVPRFERYADEVVRLLGPYDFVVPALDEEYGQLDPFYHEVRLGGFGLGAGEEPPRFVRIYFGMPREVRVPARLVYEDRAVLVSRVRVGLQYLFRLVVYLVVRGLAVPPVPAAAYGFGHGVGVAREMNPLRCG